MSVTTATTFLPASVPMSTIRRPRSSAAFCVLLKLPWPHLTSKTMASEPLASFLLMMEDAISEMLFTVPVTSRSA